MSMVKNIGVTFFSLCIMFSINVESSYAQGSKQQKYFRNYIITGNQNVEKGDFLIAAKIFQHVHEFAEDSSIKAEALYLFNQAGNKAASHITNVNWLSERIISDSNNSILEGQNERIEYWNKNFQPLIDSKIEAFKEIGINLKLVSYFETYYVNADTSVQKILLTDYKNTIWAEKTLYRLITNEIDPNGEPAHSFHPEPVISKANKFLEIYPKSSLAKDVYHILGKAYIDIWNLYDDNKYLISASFRDQICSDCARLKSIEYFKKASDLNLENGSDNPFRDIIKSLKNKKRLNLYYYYAN